MTLQELRRHLRQIFTDACIESPDADAGLLLMHALGLSKTELLLDNRELSEEALHRILALADRRVQGEPVRYLTGVCPFLDLEFYVNSSALIPRPETELLVQETAKRLTRFARPLHLWDIGCGSGCVGIPLARMNGVTVTELDVSEEALATAARTAERYGLTDKITFLRHDILTGMPQQAEHPDVIVSNPPYIPSVQIASLQKEVRLFEPRQALDGGADGLSFYRFIITHAPLPSGGLLAFEIGFDQGESVPQLMRENGYREVTLCRDLAGQPRVVLGYHA